MNKFFALFKKEMKELVTIQVILPLVIAVAAFSFIGSVVGKETRKAQTAEGETGISIAVVDLDNTDTSRDVTAYLDKSYNVSVFYDTTADELVKTAGTEGYKTIIEIPEGFENRVNSATPQAVKNYSILESFSVVVAASSGPVDAIPGLINEYISNRLIEKKASVQKPETLKYPIYPDNHTVVSGKTANIRPDTAMGILMTQTIFIPIVMFMIIIMSSQMIATTVASEKENKTLETLLSTPIKRISLVTAKMLASGVVSLVFAAFYMLGMKYYLDGITGGKITHAADNEVSEALARLGLTLNTGDILLLGVSLFIGILIALAIALILGALSEDVKKVQGLVVPIVFLVMIPYILTIFVDLDSSSTVLKWFIYAIPFSHPFLAITNLYMGDYLSVIYGILYELVVFLFFAAVAARIFTSDRILTMKLTLKRR